MNLDMKLPELLKTLKNRKDWGRKETLSHLECGQLHDLLHRLQSIALLAQSFDQSNETTKDIDTALRLCEKHQDLAPLPTPVES